MNLVVRPETQSEAKAVDQVVESAFSSPAVAWMVREIRNLPNYIPELALVAERHGKIVGYVMMSYAELVDGPTVRQILNLSPLAVAPEAQAQGIGSALVEQALVFAEKRGEPAVALEGNPDYYGRFGFVDSRKFGIDFEEGGLVHPLSKYDSSLRGLVRYPSVFAEMQARRKLEQQG